MKNVFRDFLRGARGAASSIVVGRENFHTLPKARAG
jgi:hypothetical protein